MEKDTLGLGGGCLAGQLSHVIDLRRQGHSRLTV
jgi:hypothetical protein